MYKFLNKPRPVWFHLALMLGLLWVGFMVGRR